MQIIYRSAMTQTACECSLMLLMIDRLKPTFVTDLKMAIEKCG